MLYFNRVFLVGNKPIAPHKQSLIRSNITSALLELSSWQDGGCPIQYFSIEFRRYGISSDWIIVSSRIETHVCIFCVEYILDITIFTCRLALQLVIWSLELHTICAWRHTIMLDPQLRSTTLRHCISMDFQLSWTTATYLKCGHSFAMYIS